MLDGSVYGEGSAMHNSAATVSEYIYVAGCVLDGSVYGEGSAMHSSELCSYCFCIRGKKQCVRPRCLLPLEGCTPTYNNLSCCPVHYNCSRYQCVCEMLPMYVCVCVCVCVTCCYLCCEFCLMSVGKPVAEEETTTAANFLGKDY